MCAFVIEEELGWATAANPSAGLLLGYVWRAAQYPWVAMWRHSDEADGEGQQQPAARGLEFGTSAIHEPFTELVKQPTALGKPTFAYIDAAEAQTRSYVAFLADVPVGFAGVERVDHAESSGLLTLHERGGSGRTVQVDVGSL